ncbi:glycerate kinase [Fluviispira multicolorata]|uniref:Glycerate kinase n=1 Tax=Fluviispira multicolorata TaxID=2654512 RepID=A0A833JCW0_9BACT|nr:glycerate kinase [Fluviispira multicolorata]KAB8027432.1 glycerate kinase [Fluviispira multicolorata]
MRVVLAFDKFKGTFTARQVCELVAEGIRHRNPKIEIIQRPMADGGEGSAILLAASLGMDSLRVEVCDLLGKPAEANVFWQNARRLAVLESAEVLGNARALATEEGLFQANTWGLGKLLQKAFPLRPQEIWLCIGGTLTVDAGWGIASAFGLSAYDTQGNHLKPCLENMEKVDSFKKEELPEYMKKCKISVLCDVNAPASGPGVSLISFLKQKGAQDSSIPLIEKRIHFFWNKLKHSFPNIPRLEDPFMGAGGGICIGLSVVFPNLKIEMGSKKIAKVIALAPSFSGTDLVVCGEGSLDDLTLYGKAVSTVAQLAIKSEQKIIGIFGKVTGNRSELKNKLGLSEIITLMEENQTGQTTNEIMKNSKLKLFNIGQDLAEKISKKNQKNH